jgi:hypothetical protein
VAKWLTSGHTHFPVIGKIPYSSPRCPPVPTYIDVYEGVGGVQYVFGDGGKLIFGNWPPENTRHDLVLLLRHSINAHVKALGDRHLVLYFLSGPIASQSAILLVLFLFAFRRAHEKFARWDVHQLHANGVEQHQVLR